MKRQSLATGDGPVLIGCAQRISSGSVDVVVDDGNVLVVVGGSVVVLVDGGMVVDVVVVV